MTWADEQKIKQFEKNKFTEASVTRITSHGKDGFIIVSTSRSIIAPQNEDGTYDFNSWQSLFKEFLNYCEKHNLPVCKDREVSFKQDRGAIQAEINENRLELDPDSVEAYLKERNKECDTELYKYLQGAKNPYSFLATYGGYAGQTGELSDVEPSFIIFNNPNLSKDRFAGGWQELLARGLKYCEVYKQDAIYVQAPGRPPVYMDKDGKKLDWFDFGGWTYNRKGNYYTSNKRKMKGPKTFTAMNLAEHMAFRGHQPKGLIDAMRMSTTGELWRGPESLEDKPTVYIN